MNEQNHTLSVENVLIDEKEWTYQKRSSSKTKRHKEGTTAREEE